MSKIGFLVLFREKSWINVIITQEAKQYSSMTTVKKSVKYLKIKSGRFKVSKHCK